MCHDVHRTSTPRALDTCIPTFAPKRSEMPMLYITFRRFGTAGYSLPKIASDDSSSPLHHFFFKRCLFFFQIYFKLLVLAYNDICFSFCSLPAAYSYLSFSIWAPFVTSSMRRFVFWSNLSYFQVVFILIEFAFRVLDLSVCVVEFVTKIFDLWTKCL